MGMEELQKAGEELLRGRKGEALRRIAATDAAQRLSRSLDAAMVESAVKSGDPAQIKALLTAVLNDPDGRALAEMLSRGGHE